MRFVISRFFKSTLFSLLISIVISYDVNSQIKFPDSNEEVGYKYSDVHARVAMPLDGSDRIWVKGSKEHPRASVLDSENDQVYSQFTLSPPYYTKVINTSAKIVKVKFCAENSQECITTENLYPSNYVSNTSEDFSILLYGCMEPFEVAYEDKKPVSGIFEGENNSSRRVRELFRKVALEESVPYSDSLKIENEFVYQGRKDSILLRTHPKAIITTGDQVYIDAGYGTKMKGKDVHPLSAWETKRRPFPFDTVASNYVDYINKLYSATYSFTDIEAAHKRLPVLSTIDDHELRDGWGSHGDEYEKAEMNPRLKNFYLMGKEAFIDHQLSLSTYVLDSIPLLKEGTKSMDYNFEINGINGYVFDLRSSRNVNQGVVLGGQQWTNFEKWLDQLERNQEIVLVTSVPLTLRPLKLFEILLQLFKPELRDDVRDGWSSKNNIKERNRLIALLTKYRRERDIKPIFVSGDVHKSALIEIWVDPYVGRNSKHDVQETMILGYEIVASGMSHEFIKTGISKSLLKITESQRIGDGFIDFTFNGNRASLYPMVRSSKVSQNFGAIEFSKDKNTRIHTFVYDNDSNHIEQIYLELDFDKKLPDDDYYIIEKNQKSGKVKRTFSPPIPHGKHAIID
ncbi:PhoD-like phosphatase [Flavobacteriaceae bacterium MAR_2010_188]|nr:PhoD-like phosphatase [Flavobacteriaceae bacterium MAR_2010_188]